MFGGSVSTSKAQLISLNMSKAEPDLEQEGASYSWSTGKYSGHHYNPGTPQHGHRLGCKQNTNREVDTNLDDTNIDLKHVVFLNPEKQIES